MLILIKKYLEALDKEIKHAFKCQQHRNEIETLTDFESQRDNDKKKIQTALLKPELPEMRSDST